MGQISSGPVSSVAWVRGVDISLEMLERDPYPAFASLQEFEPVAFVPSSDMWLVTRWDDVVYVCEHPELFGSNTEPSWLRDCLGENMLTLDGSAHDHLADGMRSPFVSSSALPVVRDGLPALFDELIDGFDSAGDVELMSAYAEPRANLTLAAAPWVVRGLARSGGMEPWGVHRHCHPPGDPRCRAGRNTHPSRVTGRRLPERSQSQSASMVAPRAVRARASGGRTPRLRYRRASLPRGVVGPPTGSSRRRRPARPIHPRRTHPAG